MELLTTLLLKSPLLLGGVCMYVISWFLLIGSILYKNKEIKKLERICNIYSQRLVENQKSLDIERQVYNNDIHHLKKKLKKKRSGRPI